MLQSTWKPFSAACQVHSPDRLARNYAYQVLLLEEWRRARIEVVFLNHPLGASPEDNQLLQVQAVVAEYERAMIKERNRRSKKHAASTWSLNVMSGAPYGYRYVNVHEGQGTARYEPNPEQAGVVRQIFVWVARERCSFAEVSRRLEKTGHPTPTGRKTWSRNTLWRLLHNPAYKGTAAYGKTKVSDRDSIRLRPYQGKSPISPRKRSEDIAKPEEWITIPVPALVDEGLFVAAQQQLRQNFSYFRQGARPPHYLLHGLTCCSQCGYAYYGKSTTERKQGPIIARCFYYRCSGTDAARFGNVRICDNRQLRADVLEAAVLEVVCDVLREPARMHSDSYQTVKDAEGADDLSTLRTQISNLRRDLERLIDGYSQEVIDQDQFAPRVQQIKQRITELQARTDRHAETESQSDEIQAYRFPEV